MSCPHGFSSAEACPECRPDIAETISVEGLKKKIWQHVLDMESTAKNARDNADYMASEYVMASSRRLRKKMGWPILGVPPGYGEVARVSTDSSRSTCSKYEWWVYSTALSSGVLMLYCENTGKTATVRDPLTEEWKEAFYAPSNPYRWYDESRVVLDD